MEARGVKRLSASLLHKVKDERRRAMTLLLAGTSLPKREKARARGFPAISLDLIQPRPRPQPRCLLPAVARIYGPVRTGDWVRREA